MQNTKDFCSSAATWYSPNQNCTLRKCFDAWTGVILSSIDPSDLIVLLRLRGGLGTKMAIVKQLSEWYLFSIISELWR